MFDQLLPDPYLMLQEPASRRASLVEQFRIYAMLYSPAELVDRICRAGHVYRNKICLDPRMQQAEIELGHQLVAELNRPPAAFQTPQAQHESSLKMMQYLIYINRLEFARRCPIGRSYQDLRHRDPHRLQLYLGCWLKLLGPLYDHYRDALMHNYRETLSLLDDKLQPDTQELARQLFARLDLLRSRALHRCLKREATTGSYWKLSDSFNDLIGVMTAVRQEQRHARRHQKEN